MADEREDTGEDTRWLSYSELADVRGISRDSVVRIARRKGWPRRTGNDGTVRVAVPRDLVERPPRGPRDSPGDSPPDGPPDNSRIVSELEARIAALDAHIATLNADLARERAIADEARAGRTAAEAAREQTLADLRDEREAARVLAEELARVRTSQPAEEPLAPDAAVALEAELAGEVGSAEVVPLITPTTSAERRAFWRWFRRRR